MAAGLDSDAEPDGFEALVGRARLRLLRMHYEAGVGHLGGNLSAIDALIHLHHREMTDDDRFVLSKGHAAGALYVALWSCGLIGDDELQSFHADGTRLAGHPVPGWNDGIPVATGSLGHGLPIASGIALAKRLEGEPGRVFCLTSDGEWQEGSNWEALIFARHQRLDGLHIWVDANGLQGFGSTEEVASQTRGALRGRFEAFDVPVREIDGHDPKALADAVLVDRVDGPRVVILHTRKGKGVSFMEDKLEWHYLPLTDEQYAQALRELRGEVEAP